LVKGLRQADTDCGRVHRGHSVGEFALRRKSPSPATPMLTADVTAVSYPDLRTIIFMNFANRNLHEGPRKEVTAAMSGAATPATDFREEFLENESATNKVTQDHNAKAESLFEMAHGAPLLVHRGTRLTVMSCFGERRQPFASVGPVHASHRCPHRGCIRPRFANRNYCSVVI
jgi:hypothetical protein